MRETEITVQVFGKTEDIKQKIENLGFNLERHVIMSDSYFSKLPMEELTTMPYSIIMQTSILVRKFEGDTNKVLFHYKDKQYDDEGNVVSEEKLTEPLVDAENVIKILNRAKLTNWCNIVQDMFIFKGKNMEFALQCVDGLGTYIEYEEDESVADLPNQEKIEKMVEKLKSLGLSLGKNYSVKKVYDKFMKENHIEEERI